MRTFAIQRLAETPNTTKGRLVLAGSTVPLCALLEGGKANAPHNRIPAGTYALGFKGPSKFDRSPYDYPTRFADIGYTVGHMIEITGVAGRTAIEIHPGNSFTDTLGCPMTGQDVVAAGPAADFIIPDGQAAPAFRRIWPILAQAVRYGGAQLEVTDITDLSTVVA